MKARLIKPAKAVNPEYCEADARKAKADGVQYEIPKIITREPGHIQDHPDSWRHCVNGFMNSEAIAVPADEECKAAVRKWQEQRPDRIKKLAEILKVTSHPELRAAYATELNQYDPEAFPLRGNDAEIHEEDEDD